MDKSEMSEEQVQLSQGKVRLNVRVPRQLLKECRIKALQEGTTLSYVVRGFLSRYVREDQPQREGPSA